MQNENWKIIIFTETTAKRDIAYSTNKNVKPSLRDDLRKTKAGATAHGE